MSQRPVLGLDSMVFIYHLELHDEFGSAASRLLAHGERGRCRLVTSTLTRMEILVLPTREGRTDLCQAYRALLDGLPNLALIDIDAEVADIAAELRAHHPLRTPDALHLAAAIHGGADAFVTEDRRHFPDRVGGMEILRLEGAEALVSRR